MAEAVLLEGPNSLSELLMQGKNSMHAEKKGYHFLPFCRTRKVGKAVTVNGFTETSDHDCTNTSSSDAKPLLIHKDRVTNIY